MTGPLPNGPAADSMEVGSGRRLTLAPEAMWLETWTGGVWARLRPITYGEIQTVYSYDQRDWGFVGVMALIWLVLIGVLLMLGAALGWNLGMGGLGALLTVVTLGLGGLAAYRVRTMPKRMLRIDTHTGSLIVPRRQPRFFHSLGAHLAGARSQAPPLEALSDAPTGFGSVAIPPPPGMGAPPLVPAPDVPPSIGPTTAPPPPVPPAPYSPGQPAPPSSPSESGKAPWET